MEDKQFIARIFTESFNLGIESCQKMIGLLKESPEISNTCELLNKHLEKLKLSIEDVLSGTD